MYQLTYINRGYIAVVHFREAKNEQQAIQDDKRYAPYQFDTVRTKIINKPVRS